MAIPWSRGDAAAATWIFRYLHPDEYWMPVDEEMYRMRKMQDVINDQATKYKKQPVQFVDPMQAAFFGDDEDFEPDEL